VYRTTDPGVLILEYSGHGKGVISGRPYEQKYISVATIRDAKIAHWRDYVNPLAVADTVGDGLHVAEAVFSPR